MTEEKFRKDVYGYTMELLECTDTKDLANSLAAWMSREDLRACLVANEYSPPAGGWDWLRKKMESLDESND